MSQQKPDSISRNDIAVYGESVVTFGFKVNNAIDGIGLVSRGLLWHCPQIWLDLNEVSPITTVWTAAQKGINGEC